MERLFFAFGMLFGVMIFAVILGNYQGIMEEISLFYKTADESGGLNYFFNILRKYNNFRDMPEQSKREIEAYFDYRWEVHKNQLLYEDESAFMQQLPEALVDDLLQRYLYRDFLVTFASQF
jgi:hypothetical protein